MEVLEVACTLGDNNFLTEVKTKDHTVMVDEPISVGGQNSSPNPKQYLLASLVSCTAITIRLYANNKGWETGHIEVTAQFKEVIEQNKTIKKIVKSVHFEKNLSEKQKQRLLLIGSKCPISKLLEQPIEMNFIDNQ